MEEYIISPEEAETALIKKFSKEIHNALIGQGRYWLQRPVIDLTKRELKALSKAAYTYADHGWEVMVRYAFKRNVMYWPDKKRSYEEFIRVTIGQPDEWGEFYDDEPYQDTTFTKIYNHPNTPAVITSVLVILAFVAMLFSNIEG